MRCLIEREIDNAKKEMKDCFPGEDEVRLMYICGACKEVRIKVIEIVIMMFFDESNRVG